MDINDRLIDALLPLLPKLDRAPDIPGDAVAAAIGRRANPPDRIRKCALGCKSTLGMTAILIEPCELSGYERRWLDLCAKCHHDVLALMNNWPGDDYVLSRLHRLRNEALLARA